jgi:hypothetical protein
MSVKHETITVSGLVAYCNGCGAHGPETAYDNYDDLVDQFEQMGWSQSDDGEEDFCAECTAKREKPKKSSKKRPK